MATLKDVGINYVEFIEPDIGDQLTAIASDVVYGEQRKIFKKFQLFKIT